MPDPDDDRTTPPFLEYVPSYSGRGYRTGKKKERNLGVGFLRAQGGVGRWREDSAFAMLGRKGKKEEGKGEGGVEEDEGVELSREIGSSPLGPMDHLFGEDQDVEDQGAEGHEDVGCDGEAEESGLEKTPMATDHSSAGRIKASPGSWGAGMVRRMDDMRSKKVEPDTPTTSSPRSVAGGLVSTPLRKDPTTSPLRSQRNPASPGALSRKSRAKSSPTRKSKKTEFIAPWSESEGSDEGKTSTSDVSPPETPHLTARDAHRKTKRNHAATPRTSIASSTPPRLTIQPASPGPAFDSYDQSESLFVTGLTPDSSPRPSINAESMPRAPSMNSPNPSATRNSATTPSQALRKENHDPATSFNLDTDTTKPQSQTRLARPRKKGIATKPAPKRAREISPGEVEASKKAEPELDPQAAPARRGAAAAGRKKGVARKLKPGRK